MKNPPLSLRAIFFGFVAFSLACVAFFGLMHLYEFIVFSPRDAGDATFAEGLEVLSWHAYIFMHVAFFMSVGIGVLVAIFKAGTKHLIHSALTVIVILTVVWLPAYVFASPEGSIVLSLSLVAIAAGVLAGFVSRRFSTNAGAV